MKMHMPSHTLILACALLFSEAAPAAEIPVRDFARWGDYQTVKISPDGKYVAVSKWLGDTSGLAFIDLESRKVTGSMRLVRGDSPTRFAWVGPQRVIIPIAKQYGPLDQLYLTGELIAINADGSGKKYLFGVRGKSLTDSIHLKSGKSEAASAELVHPLPGDPDYAMVSIWPWDKPDDRTLPFVDRINVNTGQRRRVSTVPSYGAAVITDEQGQPRFGAGIRPDDRCCELVAVPKGSSSWKTLTATFGDVELLDISRDGGSAYFLTRAAGQPSCLQEYAFERDEIRAVQCDSSIALEAILSVDRKPVAVRREAGKPQTTYLDVSDPAARMQKSLENSFKGQRVTITSRTLDGAKAIVLVDGDRNPGDFYLLDAEKKKVDLIMTRRSWIDPAAMQPMEPFDFTARDGMALHGYVTAPDGLAARKLPTVVMPHGGPHSVRDYWAWDAGAQLLASRGYAVLQVNYRGSAGYGLDYELAGHRKWGTAMQDDITDAVKWAVGQGIADPARICIYGNGYGGYAALMSATREPDLYRCAVGFAGTYDLQAQSKDSTTADSWTGLRYLADVIGTDPKELAAQSPVTHVGKLKAPVLIVHGTADRRVPFSQAKQLRAALEQAHKSYEWLEFSGEEHGLWLEANREAFYNKLLEFLAKHIGGGSAPPAAPSPAAAPSGG